MLKESPVPVLRGLSSHKELIYSQLNTDAAGADSHASVSSTPHTRTHTVNMFTGQRSGASCQLCKRAHEARVCMFFIVILIQWSLWCAVCVRFTIISSITSVDIHTKITSTWLRMQVFHSKRRFSRLVVWWPFLPSPLCGFSVAEGQEWGGVSRCWCWPEGAMYQGSFLTSGWAPASLEWLWDPDWMTTSLLSLRKEITGSNKQKTEKKDRLLHFKSFVKNALGSDTWNDNN